MRTVIPGPLAYAPHHAVAYGRPGAIERGVNTTLNRIGWMTLGAAALAFKQSRDTRRSSFDRAGSEVDTAFLAFAGIAAIVIS